MAALLPVVLIKAIFGAALNAARPVMSSTSDGGGRHSTEVAFALLTQQPRVRISTLPNFIRWIFERSAPRPRLE